MYNEEPIYVDDIISITHCNGRISCVRFDKEVITIRFYDRDEKQIVMERKEREFINCTISNCGNSQAYVYINVESDEIFRGYKTSFTSAILIKEYYESYNKHLKIIFLEEEQKRVRLEEEKKRVKLEEEKKIRLEQQKRAQLEEEKKRVKLEQQKRNQLEEEKKRVAERIKKQKNEKILKNINLNSIDKMTGFEFEEFIGYLFKKIGYEVIVTKKSNDQGIDIIVKDDFTKIGIQAKCYSGSVGNKAIQEAVAGKSYYKCDKVIVITNSSFTQSAIELAKCNNVGLISRKELSEMINRYC